MQIGALGFGVQIAIRENSSCAGFGTSGVAMRGSTAHFPAKPTMAHVGPPARSPARRGRVRTHDEEGAAASLTLPVAAASAARNGCRDPPARKPDDVVPELRPSRGREIHDLTSLLRTTETRQAGCSALLSRSKLVSGRPVL
jgi:hypothetical protein